MSILTVELGERSYPIYIAKGLLTNNSPIAKHIKSKRVCIITNDIVAPLYLEAVSQSLSHFDVDTLILPDGEQEKSFANFEKIMSHLLAGNHGRDTTMIALGGGVIGDITGFAAACYQRGVEFIQIPTTLLSQVDSSVGGKTAINHPLGKNMVGAFYQPNAVIIDIDTLNTLPQNEFAAGMAEVIKYGILADQQFFQWLEENADKLQVLDERALTYVIETCCQIKADIVSEDEKESGKRALLNLGHTFGHAIEAEQGYGKWLHGEAVAAGMVLASKLSNQLELMTPSETRRVESLLSQFDLPVCGPSSMSYEDYLKHMKRDKKNIGGKLRFVVPTQIGITEVRADIDEALLKSIL